MLTHTGDNDDIQFLHVLLSSMILTVVAILAFFLNNRHDQVMVLTAKTLISAVSFLAFLDLLVVSNLVYCLSYIEPGGAPERHLAGRI